VSSQDKTYRVSEITRLIRTNLESAFGSVWIEGELSNVRKPSSGHIYLTIKDADAQISGVLFRGQQRGMNFQPSDGMQVRAYGQITVYERGGNYQLLIKKLEEGGKGALQVKFEELKKKLHEEGLFDQERKKPIPSLARHVGIVTSRTGAAVRDILNVLLRRFPNIHIVLAPAKVQGDGSAEEVASAIRLLNDYGGLDVLIVGRGGGSIEDLWCFDEEAVARAISASEIPVISAVGHEIDFTISDFVADMRAPTPSAAAELVVDRKDKFEEDIEDLHRRTLRALDERVLRMRARLEAARDSYVFREPANLVKQYTQRLDSISMRSQAGLMSMLSECRQNLENVQLKSFHSVKMKCSDSGQTIKRLDSQLKALSPLAVLGRGYSVTMDENRKIVRSIDDLKPGQVVLSRVEKGEIKSEIKDVYVKE
jgi:exodeoxyribonuclease VII large subunit